MTIGEVLGIDAPGAQPSINRALRPSIQSQILFAFNGSPGADRQDVGRAQWPANPNNLSRTLLPLAPFSRLREHSLGKRPSSWQSSYSRSYSIAYHESRVIRVVSRRISEIIAQCSAHCDIYLMAVNNPRFADQCIAYATVAIRGRILEYIVDGCFC
jgi:hypothetical protein